MDDAGREILAGNTRAAARLMRDLDDEIPAAIRTLKRLYRHTGRAYILGVTGAPGAGKSTLVNRITTHLRKRGKSVGIVAIDPTSPYSGGAILGDRIRMQQHALDEGVFIKSLATRGHLGGLSRSTIDVVNVMDAMGKDVILIETVGVGQDEVEVMKAAHTTVVVTVPGLGDDIQAIKAVQVFGGYGYTQEYPAERYMRDAKLCEIGEGTSEVQRIIIARDLIRGH